MVDRNSKLDLFEVVDLREYSSILSIEIEHGKNGWRDEISIGISSLCISISSATTRFHKPTLTLLDGMRNMGEREVTREWDG